MKIFKYPLEYKDGIQEVELPDCTNVICVHHQISRPCIWAEVYEVHDNAPVTRRFEVFPTGVRLPLDLVYIGTVFPLNAQQVYHIYEHTS